MAVEPDDDDPHRRRPDSRMGTGRGRRTCGRRRSAQPAPRSAAPHDGHLPRRPRAAPGACTVRPPPPRRRRGPQASPDRAPAAPGRPGRLLLRRPAIPRDRPLVGAGLGAVVRTDATGDAIGGPRAGHRPRFVQRGRQPDRVGLRTPGDRRGVEHRGPVRAREQANRGRVCRRRAPAYNDAARRYQGRALRMRVALASPVPLRDELAHAVGTVISATERGEAKSTWVRTPSAPRSP